MMSSMLALLATALLSLFFFMAYLPGYFNAWGISGLVGNRQNMPDLPLWVERARAAHRNLTENLVHFAALILMANQIGVASTNIDMAASTFFYARLIYTALYIAGVSWFRSIAYTVGMVAEVLIAWEIYLKLVG